MYTPLTPLRFLQRAASVHPDRTAIIDGPRSFTYATMAAQVTRLAHALQARGLQPGDRVAYLAPNCAELLMAHFAVPLAGGVLVPLNTRLSPGEIAQIVEHSGAGFLVGDGPLLEPALENLSAVTTVREIVTLPGETGDAIVVAGTTDYDGLLAAGSDEPMAFTVSDENDPISLNYTSGTTGAPKGVVYTHRGAYLNSLGEVIHQGFGDGSSYLWTLPMFHCNGWCTTWALTAVAGTHVCLRAVRADDIWHLIDDAGVTHMAGAPPVLAMMMESPLAHPLRQALTFTTGGAPAWSGLRQSERSGGARLWADRDVRRVHDVRGAGVLVGVAGGGAFAADGPPGRRDAHRGRGEGRCHLWAPGSAGRRAGRRDHHGGDRDARQHGDEGVISGTRARPRRRFVAAGSIPGIWVFATRTVTSSCWTGPRTSSFPVARTSPRSRWRTH